MELSRRELVFLALLGALVAWTALSAVWSWSAPLSLLELQRGLVYLAGVAALLVVGGRASAPWLAAGVLAAVAASSAANLLVRARGPGDEPGAEALPIGYANGLGLLGAIGVVLALGLARGRAGPARAAALAAGAVAAVALALSGSRGAWLALAVGVAALVALARARAAAYPLAVGAGIAFALVAGFALGSQRERYWTVALAQAESAPLHGTGAGTFERAWLRDRPEPLTARDAHGLYVETLGELGIVGLALLASLLVVPLAAAVEARGDPAAAAGGAAYAAFLAHAGIDWDWELPAVALAGLACGVVALLAGRGEVTPVNRTAAVVAAGVALAAAAGGLAGRVAVDASAEALRDSRPADAERRARLAARLAPWSPEPRRLEGEARVALGRPDEARASFRRALELDGGDPGLWRALARASAGEERRRALRRAALLDPLGG